MNARFLRYGRPRREHPCQDKTPLGASRHRHFCAAYGVATSMVPAIPSVPCLSPKR